MRTESLLAVTLLLIGFVLLAAVGVAMWQDSLPRIGTVTTIAVEVGGMALPNPAKPERAIVVMRADAASPFDATPPGDAPTDEPLVEEVPVEVEEVPVEEPAPCLPIPATGLPAGTTLQALGIVRLYSAPGEESPSQSEHAAGTVFSVVGLDGGGGDATVTWCGVLWYQVRTMDGAIGWVLAAAVEEVKSPPIVGPEPPLPCPPDPYPGESCDCYTDCCRPCPCNPCPLHDPCGCGYESGKSCEGWKA